jgi:hypothetical protein
MGCRVTNNYWDDDNNVKDLGNLLLNEVAGNHFLITKQFIVDLIDNCGVLVRFSNSIARFLTFCWPELNVNPPGGSFAACQWMETITGELLKRGHTEGVPRFVHAGNGKEHIIHRNNGQI